MHAVHNMPSWRRELILALHHLDGVTDTNHPTRRDQGNTGRSQQPRKITLTCCITTVYRNASQIPTKSCRTVCSHIRCEHVEVTPCTHYLPAVNMLMRAIAKTNSESPRCCCRSQAVAYGLA